MRYERDGFSVRAAKAKGRPLPPDHWYFQRPAEPVGAMFYYVAYRDLVGERRFAEGPIPWSSAMAYADRKGLAPDVANALWIVVNRMDLTEREWRAEQLRAELGGGG